MFNTDAVRFHGLRRWSEYLNACMQPWGVIREPGHDCEGEDTVWRVNLRPYDPPVRIRVTEEAVCLDEKGFVALVPELGEAISLGRMIATSPRGIRIHADGQVEETPPEGIEPQSA